MDSRAKANPPPPRDGPSPYDRPTAARGGPPLLQVIHEDAEMLLVNKAAGLVCHPTKGDAYSSIRSGSTWRILGTRLLATSFMVWMKAPTWPSPGGA